MNNEILISMDNILKLTLLLILVVSTYAFGCLSATQERIIPIGTSENCLIGIEVVSNRFGNIFESLDLNNDGHLSKKEFSKLKNRKG